MSFDLLINVYVQADDKLTTFLAVSIEP